MYGHKGACEFTKRTSQAPAFTKFLELICGASDLATIDRVHDRLAARTPAPLPKRERELELAVLHEKYEPLSEREKARFCSLIQLLVLHSSAGGALMTAALEGIMRSAMPVGRMPVGRWAAGGDAGQSWKASASSIYGAADKYDMHNPQNAIDGLSEGPTDGRVYCFDGRMPFPHVMTIDFGRPVAIGQWRFKGSGDSYCAKAVKLQIQTADVPGSAFELKHSGEWSTSDGFPPMTAQVWRVLIESVHESKTNFCARFQVYMKEVQFSLHPPKEVTEEEAKNRMVEGGVVRRMPLLLGFEGKEDTGVRVACCEVISWLCAASRSGGGRDNSSGERGRRVQALMGANLLPALIRLVRASATTPMVATGGVSVRLEVGTIVNVLGAASVDQAREIAEGKHGPVVVVLCSELVASCSEDVVQDCSCSVLLGLLEATMRVLGLGVRDGPALPNWRGAWRDVSGDLDKSGGGVVEMAVAEELERGGGVRALIELAQRREQRDGADWKQVCSQAGLVLQRVQALRLVAQIGGDGIADPLQAAMCAHKVLRRAIELRRIRIEGQETGEPQSDLMGEYQLVVGKEVHGRRVWKRVGCADQWLFYVDGNNKENEGEDRHRHWWIGGKQAMEKGRGGGGMRAVAEVWAFTPEQATVGAWEAAYGKGGWVAAPKVQAKAVVSEKIQRQEDLRQEEEERGEKAVALVAIRARALGAAIEMIDVGLVGVMVGLVAGHGDQMKKLTRANDKCDDGLREGKHRELQLEAMACLGVLTRLGNTEAKQEQQQRLSMGKKLVSVSAAAKGNLAELLLVPNLGFATPAWLSRNVSEDSVYLWPAANNDLQAGEGEVEETIEGHDQEGRVDGGRWTLLGSTEGALWCYTVRVSDFEQERWWDESKIKDSMAAIAALRHIAKHDLHAVCRNFIHQNPANTKPISTENRGLSRQFFIDFETSFKLPEDMPVLVVLHMMRFLTAGTGRSFAELMQGQTDDNGALYLSGVTLFVSHYTGYVLAEDINAIDVFEQQEGQLHYSFVDVFAINQNEVGAEGEIKTLEHVIACAKTTLLVLTPWHDPGVIRRVWCLAETMWTLQLQGCVLRVALCRKERESLLAALRSNHPQGLKAGSVLESVFAIDAAKAEATKKVDADMIFSWIEEQVEDGIDGLNLRVKDGLRASLVEAVRAEAEMKREDAALMSGVGRFFADMEQYDDSLEFHKRALQIRTKSHSENHVDNAEELTRMGVAYYQKGQHDQALRQYVQALHIVDTAFGEDHISSADTLVNMATAYYAKGDHAKALRQYNQALQIVENVYGGDHISSAAILSKIGVVNYSTGAHANAMQHFERALRIQADALGQDHISSTDTLSSMGDAWHSKGSYAMAVEFYQREVKCLETGLGADHPKVVRARQRMADAETAGTFSDMAATYYQQDRHDQALWQYEQVLQILEKAYGEDHISSATTLSDMGVVCLSKGDPTRAVQYCKQALRIWERAYGEDHFESFRTLYYMGCVYAATGDYPEAIRWYEREVKCLEKTGAGAAAIDARKRMENFKQQVGMTSQ
jgi:tetratricopeptide (TPR) repeat protein